MFRSPTQTVLTALAEISLLLGATLVLAPWTASPALATTDSPGSVSSAAAPAGVLLDSPWIVDSNGLEWTYGTTASGMGTLVSRDRSSGQFVTTPIQLGDNGAIAAAYFPTSNIAAFIVRRPGLSNRHVVINLTNRSLVSTKNAASDELHNRAVTFNATGAYYIVGTSQNPARLTKYDITTGSLQSSVTLGTGLNDISAFVHNGTEILAFTNTSPVKVVPFSRTTLTLSSAISLPADITQLLEPVVSGTTAYFGTDATPGRITALNIATRAVIGTLEFGSDESGARNLVIDSATGVLYATTETATGTRLISVDTNTLSRRGHAELGVGTSATSILSYSHFLDVGFAGTRGVQTLTVAAPPTAPNSLNVTEHDGSLTVSWSDSTSLDPVLDYTATASDGSETFTCTTATTACMLTGLRNGTDYAVTVSARSAAGVGSTASSNGNPFTLPSSPSTPTSIRGDRSLSVEWREPDDGGRPIIDYTATAHPSGVACVTTTTSCVLRGLVNGEPQTVTVVSRTAAGISIPSESGPYTTPATVPGTLEIGQMSAGDGTVSASWFAPDEDGGDPLVGYRVTLWSGVEVISVVDSDLPSATFDGLTNGETYGITVSARNSVGEGPTSPPVMVTPVAPPTEPDPPLVHPPVVEPPVVDPPIVDPPITDPPVVDPPVDDPPVITRAPGSPSSLAVLARTRKHIRVGWLTVDSGTSPITDYVIQTSRFRGRDFHTVAEPICSTAWIDVRKPRRGSLFVRVIAVNDVGMSQPSAPKRIFKR